MKPLDDPRYRLMTSIAALVHARGYAAVGVDEVCRTARVKKGSFYYFFRSKQQLMVAALEQRWQQAEAKLLAAAFAADVPPLRRIDRLFELAANLEQDAKRRGGHVLGCPFGNLSAEISASDEPMRRKIAEVLARLADAFAATIREAVAAQELPADVDARATGAALVAYFEGVRLLARTHNEPKLIRQFGRRALVFATRRRGRS